MDFKKIVSQYEQQIYDDLVGLINIKSIREDELKSETTPVGPGPKEALDYMYKLAKRDGYDVVDVEHIAGHIDFSSGDETIAMLCHVDVVPAGSGWDTDPFEAVIKEDKIIGRGTLDDKGPTIAAYYAAKILTDLNIEVNKTFRMIIGTDEESDWQCTAAYFNHQPMPDLGFAPDADFPLIHGEKGISTFDVMYSMNDITDEHSVIDDVTVLEVTSGDRYNMVPDQTSVTLRIKEQMTRVIQQFENYIREEGIEGKAFVDQGDLILTVNGKSAHGSTPELGHNAMFDMIEFLDTLSVDETFRPFMEMYKHEWLNNLNGELNDMNYSHEVMGDVSINAGIVRYVRGKQAHVGVNLRFPTGYSFDHQIEQLRNRLGQTFNIKLNEVQQPHYVDPNDPFVETLLTAYQNQSGDMTPPFTIGGGTYARTLDKGVAFGAMFNDSEDLMHQANEYISKKQLLDATAIYLEALYLLNEK
ncbi:dipeptidase PepV [Abyssicoccus albus]|uniref:Succinyl-diaminopimelate desuccinylase n=1 Tax=Abyssicoccus albus TaxID=1817405 RepID=A0A3N5BJ51_9BACL|nr:dipeptidase PepV [Abyssicoccus albus]RPF57677.1 succinyl-diaminopimelate desuccinylase [Abyssicoccus albus]